MGYRMLLSVGILGSGLWTLCGQEARFFRVVGPVPVTITAFSADGNISWTNEPTNATFTVQTSTSLLSESNWVDYVEVPATNETTAQRIIDLNPPRNMALIPAGTFTMGDCMADGEWIELPLHRVYVSAFYADKYEVTQALWDDVYHWAVTNGYTFDNAGESVASNHPVQNLNWYDCAKWCNARSEKEGKIPAYYSDAGHTAVYRTDKVGLTETQVNWNAGYRLPTEAEWEKAARGGVHGHRFPWIDTDAIEHTRANYYASGLPTPQYGYAYDVEPEEGPPAMFLHLGLPYIYTSPAGYFPPNGYGLYDVAGNGMEWCWDFSCYEFTSAAQTNPHGSGPCPARSLRGGYYNMGAINSRVASRGGSDPSGAWWGFRSILPAGP